MHLSDLHLGKIVLEQSMIEDQKYILGEIIKIVKDKMIDIVMISGDVYDKSIPSVDAVNLFSNFLTMLYKNNVKVMVISGNHDSKDRLSFGNELFIDNGIYIEGVFKGDVGVKSFSDSYGNLNIYMLPFIKPYDVKRYSNKEIKTYDDAIGEVMSNINIDKSERNIIMVHQFVTSSGFNLERSESEDISLGGIDNVDVSHFKDFDYVAMGHIHGAQRLSSDFIRYSGSPLKYSFSEVNQKKSVPIIEFKEKGSVSVELVPLVPIRDMRIIKGPIDMLLSKDVYSKGDVNDYICAVITDDDYIVDAIGKLRRVYKNILKLEYDNKRAIGNEIEEIENIDSKSPMELFSEFYYMQNNINFNFHKCNKQSN